MLIQVLFENVLYFQMSLQAGLQLDAEDPTGIWLEAYVVDFSSCRRLLKVRYLGYSTDLTFAVSNGCCSIFGCFSTQD